MRPPEAIRAPVRQATGLAVLGGAFISKYLSERVIGRVGGVWMGVSLWARAKHWGGRAGCKVRRTLFLL